MKELELDPETLISTHDIQEDLPIWQRRSARVDMTRCTRCGQPWGYHLVENVEFWKCSYCSYEARERSTDFLQLLMAQYDSTAG